MWIRIRSTPPGEAPEHIRAAWVGLELPLAPNARGLHSGLGFGVLSGPRSAIGQWFALLLGRGQRETGYIVEADQAVELLAAKSPQAAAWWREHAACWIAPGRQLLFSADACEEIPEPEKA